VIVGGGFAGLNAASSLRKLPFRVTLIDRQNHHLFQPLLYQVATAALSPSDIAEPIRSILSTQDNLTVRLAEVTAVSLDHKTVQLQTDGVLERVSYDTLVLAAGARHAYFGNHQWEAHAPGLKTLRDALHIRERVLSAFERAEWTDDPVERSRLLTFVVVGAGPTGVELAGALAEIARHTVRKDFKRIDTRTARILLLEGGPSVLAAMPGPLQGSASRQLERLGVEVRTGARVTEINADGLSIGDERVESATVLWAAGVAASPLAAEAGVEVDHAGRALVQADLSLPGHPDVFVLGDGASLQQDGEALPGVAPVAITMGRHLGVVLAADLAGQPRPPFRYLDKGHLATIGRSADVGSIFGMNVSGLIAWLLWALVHLAFLVTYRNRLVVLTKWAWAWVSFERASRLIVARSQTERVD
jgi:NADH dehydrogenase